MSVESDFFAKLLETGDYDLVDNERINAKFFSGNYKIAFRFIQNFKAKYGKVPSEQVFANKFPKITLDNSTLNEPLLFYIDEVRNKMKHNTIAEALEKSSNKLEDLSTDEALKIITSAVSKIDNEFTKSEVVMYSEDALERFADYELRKNCGGIVGMSTNIPQLDYVLGGIKETDLAVIVGSTGIGKANPLSTPILTADGFITMGEVKVGT